MKIRKDEKQSMQPAELFYRLMFQQEETFWPIYKEKKKGNYRNREEN